ncbi:uncharacterized protein K452DRAFT_103006 [Aplosporella prunicola CBS 121167]|uniref:Uncharacterized protein n=1 Tax=Aplosporella prunicola CBS 121167 TaxID=1176127 RepID=A0A6A6BP41_9PEZI|nr:uncharacterized protein K452DRAFT_103006 [Aplosporella prunicola CBS 121167]KAF2145900.1 hypothetical protein K452DRAFT_103006 [Aplosporella prunicola CBS 121167]
MLQELQGQVDEVKTNLNGTPENSGEVVPGRPEDSKTLIKSLYQNLVKSKAEVQTALRKELSEAMQKLQEQISGLQTETSEAEQRLLEDVKMIYTADLERVEKNLEEQELLVSDALESLDRQHTESVKESQENHALFKEWVDSELYKRDTEQSGFKDWVGSEFHKRDTERTGFKERVDLEFHKRDIEQNGFKDRVNSEFHKLDSEKSGFKDWVASEFHKRDTEQSVLISNVIDNKIAPVNALVTDNSRRVIELARLRENDLLTSRAHQVAIDMLQVRWDNLRTDGLADHMLNQLAQRYPQAAQLGQMQSDIQHLNRQLESHAVACAPFSRRISDISEAQERLSNEFTIQRTSCISYSTRTDQRLETSEQHLTLLQETINTNDGQTRRRLELVEEDSQKCKSDQDQLTKDLHRAANDIGEIQTVVSQLGEEAVPNNSTVPKEWDMRP